MKPLLLDLFCKAGGATRGYQRAGFRVVGVDIAPQPNYCGDRFVQCDIAEEMSREDAWRFLWDFDPDAIHASPPCQAFTAYKRRPNHVAPRPNLIPLVRRELASWGVPFVIENVEGAPLENAVRYCGSAFGLDVRRHRFFESNVPLAAPPCSHEWQTPRFAPATNRTNLRSTVEVGVWRIPLAVQQQAMGIDWMTRAELSEAIPPAYTQDIGGQLLKAMAARSSEDSPLGAAALRERIANSRALRTLKSLKIRGAA